MLKQCLNYVDKWQAYLGFIYFLKIWGEEMLEFAEHVPFSNNPDQYLRHLPMNSTENAESLLESVFYLLCMSVTATVVGHFVALHCECWQVWVNVPVCHFIIQAVRMIKAMWVFFPKRNQGGDQDSPVDSGGRMGSIVHQWDGFLMGDEVLGSNVWRWDCSWIGKPKWSRILAGIEGRLGSSKNMSDINIFANAMILGSGCGRNDGVRYKCSELEFPVWLRRWLESCILVVAGCDLVDLYCCWLSLMDFHSLSTVTCHSSLVTACARTLESSWSRFYG